MKNTESELRTFIHQSTTGNGSAFKNETKMKIHTDLLPALEVIHEHKLLYKSSQNNYYALGTISQDLSLLKVTLLIEETDTGRKERIKIDLYERESLKAVSNELGISLYQSPESIENDLLTLTDLLEQFRDKLIEVGKREYQSKRATVALTPEKQKKCIDFLSSGNLIEKLDQQIEKAGVVGEENTRKLLFVLATTYKMNNPLHALVQGSSGSGKSHLINTIAECFPPEDRISMTRVTSKSFYHYTKDELVDKLLLIQDYDGLDEEAQYAFRELQSAGTVHSSTIHKDRFGNLKSTLKTVKSNFASLLATTKAEIYYDNMSRCLVTGIDESDEQTKRIIQYQNQKLAGIIDEKDEREAKEFLQNCIRTLKVYDVVNPYADKIQLPIEAKSLRRLNSHYQAFVKQITILNQHQRRKDEKSRLIAEPQDLQIACDILFDAIILKVDELDSSLRQFFEKLKKHVEKLKTENAQEDKRHDEFTLREIRFVLNISKTTCFRYMEELIKLEYVQRIGGYINKGFKYKILFWDDIEKIRTSVKNQLAEQLSVLNHRKMERKTA